MSETELRTGRIRTDRGDDAVSVVNIMAAGRVRWTGHVTSMVDVKVKAKRKVLKSLCLNKHQAMKTYGGMEV
jgi:hypothetical protein